MDFMELQLDNTLRNELGAKYNHRSGRELDVHVGLVGLGARVCYEMPTEYSVKYLPDFTWTNEFETEQHLAAYQAWDSAYRADGGQCSDFTWIEVKPQDFLYQLRNTCFSTSNRAIGEHFKGPISCALDSGYLWDMRGSHDVFKELAAPKKLAESSGRNVLVISTTTGTSTLSVYLTRNGIVFERNHPLVNSRYWANRLTREEKRREQERQAEDARRLYELERAERRREQERLVANVKCLIASQDPSRRRVNDWSQQCLACSTAIEPRAGYLLNHEGRWHVMHRECVTT
jgi:hypothetical protein